MPSSRQEKPGITGSDESMLEVAVDWTVMTFSKDLQETGFVEWFYPLQITSGGECGMDYLPLSPVKHTPF